MDNLFKLIILLVIIYGCEPIPNQSTQVEKKVVYDNHNYESMVGMVQLYPFEDGNPSVLEYPVVTLGERQQLFLQFDLLTDQFEYLAAKVYHCNWNWKKSPLRDMEFLREINTFRITEFDYSLNTTTPYIQYRLIIPKPFISGNYLVTVHRRGAPGDILLTRKFSVIENTSIIDQQVRVSTTVSKRELNQQIDFSINYGNLQVNNPTNDIKIVLMQNHQWDRAI
ncbi:MAG: type IX secretion system plug protein domain-containing protein, partial [Bacteroidota bacterium]